MTGATSVLIAAFSGRSLAQSARRAGYEPLVVDAFGDLDTQEAAADFRVLDGVMETGFRTKPLIAALEDLSRSASSKPIGLVLGSGFEDKPRLVAALASRFKLLGSDAATYKACKDPTDLLRSARQARHSASRNTNLTPPNDPTGWITKRIGGSGGRHIRVCHGPQRIKPRRYFQKLVDGNRISAGAVFAKDKNLVSLTRQWISPSAEHPFRFGGCVSMPAVDDRLRRQIAQSAERVATELNLIGLASFDFIVSAGVPYLLEVNPRPGASLDILDDGGELFAAHIAVWTGANNFPGQEIAKAAKAIAILHADRGPITLGETPWPDWSADRGAPGTFVPRGAPLATAFAEASTADAAEALARTRLAELEDLIYGHAKSSP